MGSSPREQQAQPFLEHRQRGCHKNSCRDRVTYSKEEHMKFSDRDLYRIPAWLKFLRCSTSQEAINRISQAAVAGLHSLRLPSCTLPVEPQAPHLTQSVEETSSRATFCSAAPGQELIMRILAMCNDVMLTLAARDSLIVQSNIN